MAPGVLTEITVRSPSLAEGYFRDSERTSARFAEGALRTGDLGFVRDGHLYPVGRMDDVISIGGRKVYAREVEAAIDGLTGVRQGCSTLVERPGEDRGRLAILLELRDEEADLADIAERAAEVAMRKAAVALDECILLPRGALPKTPSGKIQRYRCRMLLAAGRLTPVATIDLAGRAG
jgi:fatty-acyl-CoA synthase